MKHRLLLDVLQSMNPQTLELKLKPSTMRGWKKPTGGSMDRWYEKPKTKKRVHWIRFFALLPVRTKDGHHTWLRHVWRRREYDLIWGRSFDEYYSNPPEGVTYDS